MDKKKLIRTVGCAAAAAAIVVGVCGCSIMKMAYRDVSSAEAAAGEGAELSSEYVTLGGGGSESGPMEGSAGLTVEAAVGEAAPMHGGHSSADETFKQYEKYGAVYSEINGEYWFADKPIAVFYDPGRYTMTNGNYMEIGAYVLVTRDALGTIKDVTEVTRDEMKQALSANSSMVLGNESLEQTARQEGFRYYTEDVNVKDMTVKQLNELIDDLHAKYRHQNAVVRCNDYVTYLYKDELLRLSSFCGSDNNRYGVQLSADYNIADEIDLEKLDSVEIDHLLLDMLSKQQFNDAREVESAAKKTVAGHYGISEKNLIALSSVIS